MPLHKFHNGRRETKKNYKSYCNNISGAPLYLSKSNYKYNCKKAY